MLLLAASAHAQGAATVPASSEVYGTLESVSALFPRRGVFLGERSLSRRQIEALVDRLYGAIDSAAPGPERDWARRRLMEGVVPAMRAPAGMRTMGQVALLTGWRGEVATTNAEPERMSPNGLGSIDAVTHPFQSRREGWPLGEGATATFAPTAVLTFGDRFALAVEPRASRSFPRQGRGSGELRLHRAYARAVFRNLAARLGADEMQWGQSSRALFLSRNASPFPALVIGMDTGVTLPWLFRLAGPTRATAFVADLGPAQDPPHARLAGWQVTITPWSRFELGVAVLAQTGGNGGPKATFAQRAVDLFPIIDAIAPQHADLQISNKLAGGNLRFRIPELSGLDLYYELQIDDFDARRLRSSLTEDAAHLLGARLPLVIGAGQLVWRAEWHHTSLRLYEHAQFRSGVTYRDRIIGDPLGPNARGAFLSGSWESARQRRLEFTLATERRDPSLYVTTSNNARDEGFRFVRVTDDPEYVRTRLEAALDQPIAIGAVRLDLGYNRASRAGSPSRGAWLAEVGLRSHVLPAF